MSKSKITDLPVDIQIALINAARDVAVAKITQKKAAFDGYCQPYYWFERAMDEVVNAYKNHSDPSK